MQLLTCASAAAPNSMPTPMPSPAATKVRQQHRVLLVGVGCFGWLRVLQERAPGPRVDLRYLVEGAVALLESTPSLTPRWMDASRQALVDHVAGRTALNGSRTGRRQATDGAHTSASTNANANARNQGSPTTGTHHEDCKALQVGEGAFQWLKTVQGTTRDPRLDMRYLVEGALSLLDQNPDLLPAVLGNARRALRAHLDQLETLPIEPFSLEKPQ